MLLYMTPYGAMAPSPREYVRGSTCWADDGMSAIPILGQYITIRFIRNGKFRVVDLVDTHGICFVPVTIWSFRYGCPMQNTEK